ncbi:MAG: hypothetical protein ACRD3G_24695 [Vicinamibacterales bacterium]
MSAQAPAPLSTRAYAAYILKDQKPEPPQTVLEGTVQREGRTALPLVWQALATGTESERRAAAALLSWYRDVRSIRPILAALDQSLDAVSRQQLLFDLNMILLTEGAPANAEQTSALATAHLRRAYEELAGQTDNDNVGPDTVLSANTIAVFPDPGIPDSVSLSGETRRVRSPRGLQLPTGVAATAVRSELPQAFIQAVKKDRYGVAFHLTRIADGVARVASTLYLPNRGATTAPWISLYRQSGDQWVPISIPRNMDRLPSGASLSPSISRDYGSDDPMKIVGLDLAMERIRVDVNARSWLGWEDGDFWSSRSRLLDVTYVPLLERYIRSDVPSVRYTAEFESFVLGRQNLQLWLDTLQQPEGPFLIMARRVVGSSATDQIKSEGRQLQGSARNELVNAALKPHPVNPGLLPNQLPEREHVQQVQSGSRFATVEVVLRGRGYTMVFERRGDRWIYLLSVNGWLA